MENGFSFKEMRIERKREKKSINRFMNDGQENTKNGEKKDELAHVRCREGKKILSFIPYKLNRC